MSKTSSIRRYVLAMALGALGGLSLPMAVEAQEPAQPRAERSSERVAMRRARPRMERARMRARQARADRSASATALLNARRRLDLTSRQVMQLDSIERAQVTERRATVERVRETMRAQRDSAQPRPMRRRNMRAMTPEQREALRDSMQVRRDSARARRETMRPEFERLRLADSTARAAAERVLTDEQRQRVREMQAEARGRARGVREARREARRGQNRRPE